MTVRRARRGMVHSLVSYLGSFIVSLIFRTVRWEYQIAPEAQQACQEPTPLIITFWHRRLLMMSHLYNRCRKNAGQPSKIKCFTSISAHRDGRLIAGIVKRLGIDSVAGSSTRGGSKAVRKLLKCMKEGHDIAITPDGPKGPIFEVKPGVIALARLSSYRLLPMSYTVEKSWQLKSWDRFVVPRPFSRGVMYVRKPVVFESEVQLTQELKEALSVCERK